MPEVTIEQILAAREKRVEIQANIINKYQKPIVSYTMNIAGPEKKSKLIERGFFEGIKLLKKRIPEGKIINEQMFIKDTGCEAFFSIDMQGEEIKEICISIEEDSSLGRLFDMDVIDTDGKKYDRSIQRNCIVCGAEGRNCAAGRLHSVSELQNVTKEIISNYFFEKDRDKIAGLVVKSLIDEVTTTPKPGLVDKNNNGSHNDMNYDTFVASANALYPYFFKCFTLGHELKSTQPADVFQRLKQEGVEAEKTMYKVTKGVNTHKGAIYSMGIICASLGRLWDAANPIPNISDISNCCSELVKTAVYSDFKNIDDSTAGGYYYRKYGIKGIRGEVLSGFNSVVNISLPTYKTCIRNGTSHNDAGVYTLIKLISSIKDTNLYRRGGCDGAKYATECASAVLKSNTEAFINNVITMDDDFIKKNLSPGGCADLLAITYFFYYLLNEKNLAY